MTNPTLRFQHDGFKCCANCGGSEHFLYEIDRYCFRFREKVGLTQYCDEWRPRTMEEWLNEQGYDFKKKHGVADEHGG
jgi:hypothetical protein